MPADFVLDLEGLDAEKVETRDRVQAGWYHAKVEDVSDHQHFASAMNFNFVILNDPNGRCNGMHVSGWVGDEEGAESEAQVRSARQKKNLWAKRLGLAGSDDYGKKTNKSWYDAIGVEVVIKVEDKPNKKNPDNPFQEVSYGLWPANYEKPISGLPNALRYFFTNPVNSTPQAEPGKPAANGQGAAIPPMPPPSSAPAPVGAPAAHDFSDL